MYPHQCYGGHAMPITKEGKYEIWGIVAKVSDATAASRIKIVDSNKFKVVADDGVERPVLADFAGLANADGNIGIMFPAPIKVRNGVTVSKATNLLGGSIQLFVR